MVTLRSGPVELERSKCTRYTPCGVLLTLGLLASSPGGHAVELSLNQRVMVVYNASNADSLDVARHYVQQRAIPAANLCPVSPASTTKLSWSQYVSTVRDPVRDCLTTVGPESILYIVLAYQMPYKVSGSSSRLQYALDSYLADLWDHYATKDQFPYPSRLQPYYAAAQSQGNLYPKFLPFSDFRNRVSAPPLYSVWRLDGASADLAKGLVDKAIAAESLGLYGQACLDRRKGAIGKVFDSGYGEGDWDLYRAARFAEQAGLPVVEDEGPAEFGSSPAPDCPAAALYSGWYQLDHYNDAFTWVTGAIGFHLDSLSAANPRGGANWAANALMKGIAVTSGSVAEPYLEGLVRPGGTFRDLFQGATVGDAFLRNTRWLKWMLLYIGDPLYRPFPAGRPPFNPPRPQASLSMAPRYIVNGGQSAGTVTLARPAPEGGVVVTLSSDKASLVQVPESVTIPAGQRSGRFTATATALPHVTAGLATTVQSSASVQNSLTVVPLLGGLALDLNKTIGGVQTGATILLNAKAPAGGATVALSVDSPAITVPAMVKVPKGADRIGFAVDSAAVAQTTVGVITARLNDAEVKSTLTLQPALPAVATATAAAAGAPATVSTRPEVAAPAGGW